MNNYLVGYNDGREDCKFRQIRDYSAMCAAAQFADGEVYSGRFEPTYKLLVRLDDLAWEATLETIVEFEPFLTEV